MDDAEIGIGTIGLIIIIALWVHINTLNNKIDAREKVISDCSSQIDEANDKINEANGQIEEAQNEVWSDYESMGQTIGNLSTVETVYNDCSIPMGK